MSHSTPIARPDRHPTDATNSTTSSHSKSAQSGAPSRVLHKTLTTTKHHSSTSITQKRYQDQRPCYTCTTPNTADGRHLPWPRRQRHPCPPIDHRCDRCATTRKALPRTHPARPHVERFTDELRQYGSILFVLRGGMPAKARRDALSRLRPSTDGPLYWSWPPSLSSAKGSIVRPGHALLRRPNHLQRAPRAIHRTNPPPLSRKDHRRLPRH